MQVELTLTLSKDKLMKLWQPHANKYGYRPDIEDFVELDLRYLDPNN